MIYTILAEDGTFGINRDFRKIDLGSLPAGIASIQYDTERQTGVIEYARTEMITMQVRDLEREEQEYTEARKNNKRLSDLQPRYKTVNVRRAREVISDFTRFESLVALWEQAAPPEQEPTTETPKDRLTRLLELLEAKGILNARDLTSLE